MQIVKMMMSRAFLKAMRPTAEDLQGLFEEDEENARGGRRDRRSLISSHFLRNSRD